MDDWVEEADYLKFEPSADLYKPEVASEEVWSIPDSLKVILFKQSDVTEMPEPVQDSDGLLSKSPHYTRVFRLTRNETNIFLLK